MEILKHRLTKLKLLKLHNTWKYVYLGFPSSSSASSACVIMPDPSESLINVCGAPLSPVPPALMNFEC